MLAFRVSFSVLYFSIWSIKYIHAICLFKDKLLTFRLHFFLESFLLYFCNIDHYGKRHVNFNGVLMYTVHNYFLPISFESIVYKDVKIIAKDTYYLRGIAAVYRHLSFFFHNFMQEIHVKLENDKKCMVTGLVQILFAF